jgi:glycosyltransferase involved in cell wall biosynthesis
VRLYGLIDPFGFGTAHLPNGTDAIRDPIVPRPVPTQDAARAALGISDDAFVVGLLGAINQRKNPGVIAEACAQAFDSTDGKLLVVGKVEARARERIEAAGLNSEQISLSDDYVSEQDLVTAASACNIIALLYDNAQSPSGILALACQVGALVLVPKNTPLADLAYRAGIGVPCSIDARSASNAIDKVIREKLRPEDRVRDAISKLSDNDFVAKLTMLGSN